MGSVVAADGRTTVVSLSASVSSDKDVATTYTEQITNANLYYAEIDSVREAIDEFNAEKRALEDAMMAEELNEPEEEPVPKEPVEEEPTV